MTTSGKIWKCPNCKKEFAKTNQSHKCEVVDIKTLFLNKDEKLFEIYKHLISKLKSIGNFTVTTSKKAITVYAESRKAFLGIVVKRSCLDIWFLLNRKEGEFPVYKIMQPSKNKFGHFVRLYDKDDIDDTLLGWLGESYKLVS